MAEGEPGDTGVARLEPNFIIGYTTRTHLLLDLDDTSLEKARRLAYMIMEEWPKVGDCLVVESSRKRLVVRVRYSWNNHPWMSRESPNYHLIFDNIVGYNTCCRICETLAELGVLNRDYVKIRTFRGDMTLRVSHQNLSTGAVKPPPEPVEYLFNTAQKWRDQKIDDYLALRRAALGGLPAAQMVAEVRANGGATKGLQA
ncbi:hypothetical protein MUO93_06785 [Candidatus Bathyarchaeota archaeon]|nr:hypothetical protein [Candidatus Bathyarchaeota archaeon]